MPSKPKPIHYSCFWGFIVIPGLYNSCMSMFNLRCLGIVFNLDEALVVANTMSNFKDKITKLQQKLEVETDKQIVNALSEELKRYQNDANILKQFEDNDEVVEDGIVFKVQTEAGHILSESYHQVNRPVIRLENKSIILTRIDPNVRDTSILVRVRPKWEKLHGYLNVNGRKRFDVYICTRMERRYAIAIWRLLDPESSLINSDELPNRVVCVKHDKRKALSSIFQGGKCHPNMSLIIDNRTSDWNFKDQSRVHIVPAFAPYCSLNSESVNSDSVLSDARTVACNVRNIFFREYDDYLLPCMAYASYEDDMQDFQPAPDVKKILINESSSLEEGELDRSELDPDTFRRLQELQHAELEFTPSKMSIDFRNHSTENKIKRISQRLNYESLHKNCTEDFNNREEVNHKDKSVMQEVIGSDRVHRNQSKSKHVSFKEEDMFPRHSLSTTIKGAGYESNHVNDEFERPFGEHCQNPVEVLKEIAWQSGGEVKYKTDFVDNSEVQFYVEVWFLGEKIGDGMGKTRIEAQNYAAEEAIHYLACRKNEFPELPFYRERKRVHANKFDSYNNPNPSFEGHPTFSSNDHRNISNESHQVPYYAHGRRKKPVDSVDVLEEICTSEGFNLIMKKAIHEQTTYAQAEVGGQILGEGTGPNWNQAMIAAAEVALVNFKSMFGRFTPKYSRRRKKSRARGTMLKKIDKQEENMQPSSSRRI